MKHTLMTLSGAAVIVGFSALAGARPDAPPRDDAPPPEHRPDGPGPRADGPERDGPELSEPRRRDIARRIMSSTLDRFRRQQRIMEESLDMLDRGEPLDKIRAHAEEARGGLPDWFDREGDRGGRGPGRGFGGQRGPGGPGGLDEQEGPGGPMRRPQPGGGPGPGGPGPGEPGFGPPPLSPEQRAEALDLLRERGPEIFARMEKLRVDRPREFDDMLRQRMPTLMKWLKEKADDPELYAMRTELMALERDAQRLGRRLSERPDGTPEGEDGARLRALLGQMFELRLKTSQREIDRLANRLEKMRDEIVKRAGGRDALIQRRFDELTNPPPDDAGGDPTLPPPRGRRP